MPPELTHAQLGCSSDRLRNFRLPEYNWKEGTINTGLDSASAPSLLVGRDLADSWETDRQEGAAAAQKNRCTVMVVVAVMVVVVVGGGLHPPVANSYLI